MQCEGATVMYLEELKGSALFQLLEHGSEVAPTAPRLLKICSIALPRKQRSWCIGKVGLEGEQFLHAGGTMVKLFLTLLL